MFLVLGIIHSRCADVGQVSNTAIRVVFVLPFAVWFWDKDSEVTFRILQVDSYLSCNSYVFDSRIVFVVVLNSDSFSIPLVCWSPCSFSCMFTSGIIYCGCSAEFGYVSFAFTGIRQDSGPTNTLQVNLASNPFGYMRIIFLKGFIETGDVGFSQFWMRQFLKDFMPDVIFAFVLFN